MEMTGTQALPVPLLSAWAALNDTTMLQQAIPGCESIVPQTGDHVGGVPTAYDLVIGATVGPIKARFRGTLKLTDLAPPRQYVLRFDGGAGFIGQVSGSAVVGLTSLPDGTTQLAYVATASAAGRIAKVGPALIDRAARNLIDRFFVRFAEGLL